MFALALDMGGTHIGCGVVEKDALLAHASLSTPEGAQLADMLPDVTRTLQELIRGSGMSGESCLGVALGFPGIVDARSGRIASTLKKYADAPEVDLCGWARRTFGAPLRIENDARLALLGEHFAGAAKGVDDVLMLTLGTGIGSAVLLEGRLLRGAHAQAGCLGGHITLNCAGKACHCGNIGCAEAEAGGWALPAIVRGWPGFQSSSLQRAEQLNFSELFRGADECDAVALQVVEHCRRVWAATVVSLIHAYDPQLVVLGGGVMNAADRILPFVQEYVRTHTWSSWGTVPVRAATLGDRAALYGAVPLLSECM